MDILYKYNDVIFEWNSDKADRVLQDHKITMQEACTIFFDENEITMRDTRFNYGEEQA